MDVDEGFVELGDGVVEGIRLGEGVGSLTVGSLVGLGVGNDEG